MITAALWMCSGIRGLGIVVEVHRSHLGAKRDGTWCYGELDGTGVARPVGGREHVPCLPGYGDGATGVRWHGRDTRRARGCWVAPGGVARGLGPLLAATGGAATAEASNTGEARRHRCQESAKRACGALAREERPCATRQGTQLIGDNSLTKKRH